MLYGQGLAGDGQWDGTIYIHEAINAFTFSSSLSVGNIVDTVRIEQRLNTVLIVLICISFSANHSSRKL